MNYDYYGDFMNEEKLITYYNKFNEDKRLNTKHGQIEYITTMKYIHKFLKKGDRIIDIGAGTGKYSIALANEGYDVTAVELVKHNLRVIEQKSNKVKTFQGNATNLKKIDDETYNVTLLFGPMYHLITQEEKIMALNEAKRVTKKKGIILVAYCMNEYAVLTHGFKDNHIFESIKENKLNNNFHITSTNNDLYSMVRLEDINELNKIVNLKRIKIISPDGPANYIRDILNKMDNETFSIFLDYHLSTCERQDLIGAGAHTLDILKK